MGSSPIVSTIVSTTDGAAALTGQALCADGGLILRSSARRVSRLTQLIGYR